GEETIANNQFTVELAEGSKAEATGTDAGTYKMGLTKGDFTVTSKNYSNINVEVVDGSLTITPIAEEVTVTITGNSKEVPYSGKQEIVTGFTYAAAQGEETIANNPVTVELAQRGAPPTTGTDAGTYKMGLTKGDFTVTSKNY